MRSVGQSLVNSGLSNRNSEDLWAMAGDEPRKVYALCCKDVHTNTHRDICPHCGRYLCWKNQSVQHAEAAIASYLKGDINKRSKKRCVPELNEEEEDGDEDT